MQAQHAVGAVIVRQLKAWGIDTVYGVVGDAVIPLLDALAAEDGFLHSGRPAGRTPPPSWPRPMPNSPANPASASAPPDPVP